MTTPQNHFIAISFRRCPYEEGTERFNCVIELPRIICVSDAVPMKRELKGALLGAAEALMKGFRRCPYEEGTESCFFHGNETF